MGKILKTAGPRHEATLSPAVAEFVKTACSIPLFQLPAHLRSFPHRWPFPRGDIYHWINVLNRFDSILHQFTWEYGLHNGPQTRPFGRHLLLAGDDVSKATAEPSSNEILDSTGFSAEGDRELLEEIISFTQLLFDNCGNRSLYSSSGYLNNILNTTSLSLLETTLRLLYRLAARYHASRQRQLSNHQSSNLLSSHYDINLDKINKLALPFVRDPPPASAGKAQSSNAKAKGKVSKHGSARSDDGQMDHDSKPLKGNDMVSIVRGEFPASYWSDWARVTLASKDQQGPKPAEEHTHRSEGQTSTSMSVSPASARRPSGLGPNRMQNHNNEVSAFPESARDGAMSANVIEISPEQLASSSLTEILESIASDIPENAIVFDILHRLRVAKAIISGPESRERIVAIRMLAIANFALVCPEQVFEQKILQQDTEEPRRLQLAHQLAELIHPPREGEKSASRKLQALAFITLEALAKHKSRSQDVLSVLNVQVSHGILFYVVRTAVAELGVEDNANTDEDEEWRQALFYLLANLWNVHHRIGEAGVAAGLLGILTEVLTQRTDKAERYHPAVLNLFDSFIINVRGAFQSLVDAKALDYISELTAFEVDSAYTQAKLGQGIPQEHRTHHTDYEISFQKQQSLRWLLRFMNHMMTNNLANFERLLRNFIDSPPLLHALRTILENGTIYGSNVWSQALEVVVNFIHNEPTSYSIVAEAGLPKAFLSAITQKVMPNMDRQSSNQGDGSTLAAEEDLNIPAGSQVQEMLVNTDLEVPDRRPNISQPTTSTTPPVAQGILPMPEAIRTIPSAFGAICLNEAGMRTFQSSGALQAFFQIFESPQHIKALLVGRADAVTLGGAFDELVRHHPPLKQAILDCVVTMTARVGKICYEKAKSGAGAKLFCKDNSGRYLVAGGRNALLGTRSRMMMMRQNRNANSSSTESEHQRSTDQSNGDVEMVDASVLVSQIGLTDDVSMEEVAETEDSGQDPTVSDYIRVVSRFLQGFTSNASLVAAFVEAGGAEYVLDLAMLPSLPYNFNENDMLEDFHELFTGLVEQKSHLVLPSVARRATEALELLEPLLNYEGNSSFFQDFTDAPKLQTEIDGTSLVKGLVQAQTLCIILRRCFEAQPTERGRLSLFTQVNLTDLYVRLVEGLGKLQQRCVWEVGFLVKVIPEYLKRSNAHSLGVGNGDANTIMSIAHTLHVQDLPPKSSTPDWRPPEIVRANLALHNNLLTLDYLLTRTPASVAQFLASLGKSLLNKRHWDAYQKQNASIVAEEIAKSILLQLRFQTTSNGEAPARKYAYWDIILAYMCGVLTDATDRNPYTDRASFNVPTLVLQAFQRLGGLAEVGHLCNFLFNEIKSIMILRSQRQEPPDARGICELALGGIKIILGFYSQVVDPRTVTESVQSQAMASRSGDKEKPDYFSPSQCLAEIRMSVIPYIQKSWDSDLFGKVHPWAVKATIKILRLTFDAESEQGAYKRSDRICVRRSKGPVVHWKLRNPTHLEQLKDKGFDGDLALEALYRCYDSYSHAQEYCALHKSVPQCPRNPVPAHVLLQIHSAVSTDIVGEPTLVGEARDTQRSLPDVGQSTQMQDVTNSVVEDSESNGTGSIPPQSLSEEGDESPQRSQEDVIAPDAGSATADVIGSAADNIAPDADQGSLTETRDTLFTDPHAEVSQSHATGGLSNNEGTLTYQPATGEVDLVLDEAGKIDGVVTVEDLDAVRSQLRASLSERCLEVLSTTPDVTFELADLISAATNKSGDSGSLSAEIVEALIDGLISLLDENDLRPQGRKIASYAHLLALVLRDKKLYDAGLEHLKESISTIIQFIRISPTQAPGESSPWIAPILLVLEMLLIEDEKPRQIEWTPPRNDEAMHPEAVADSTEAVMSIEDRTQAFEAIVEILPRIGKDESTALSVVRVLMVLTRTRQLAVRLGEKKNIQRLFVMMKQLTHSNNEKIREAFMLILRHIIEDEEIIRQVMLSEIQALFDDTSRGQMDTSVYTRTMSHLALRAPDIFVEVTNEKLMLTRFDPSQRHQTLSLKKPAPTDKDTGSTEVEADVNRAETAGGEEVKMSTEQDERHDVDATKQDIRPPPVENPDGVIHYLLCELLSYKDVVDNEQQKAPQTDTQIAATDVQMTNGVSPTILPRPETAQALPAGNPPGKPEFKPEEHPIFFYRIFLLQCLTELLACYNRTKLEFINFSRKADPQLPTTPSSKPRAGVINYLLYSLIPVGTLQHPESVALKEKYATSNWAVSLVVALCANTGERIYRKPDDVYGPEEQADLLFVRRFVLEHALKAYKDAQASSEPLEAKYARLLNLGDLFHRMLSGRPQRGINAAAFVASQKQLMKLMIEKNFITVLAHSLSDIDPSVPDAKRAVKYILRPLKMLTSTAIQLSQSPSFSSSRVSTEEAEISSASSVTEEDEGREETPDLYRNSTLGMFEAGRDEESPSDTSDEEDDEMYGEGYDDDMDFEEEEVPDDGEVISDEEVEAGGMGPIEGLAGDVGMDLEVQVNPDLESISSGDEDEDQSDDMDEAVDDDEEEDDVIEEITGDDPSATDLEDVDQAQGDWQDEDEEDVANAFVDHHAYNPEDLDDPSGPRLATIHLGEGGVHMHTHLDTHGGEAQLGQFVEEYDDDEDEDAEDEDDEGDGDVHDDDIFYDVGALEVDDDQTMSDDEWGVRSDDLPSGMRHHRHHHHHHHHHRGISPWDLLPGAPNDGLLIPPHRNYRPTGTLRSVDDGTNPLLRRPGQAPSSAPRGPGLRGDARTIQVIGQNFTIGPERGHFPRGSPLSYLNALLSHPARIGPDAFQITIGGTPGPSSASNDALTFEQFLAQRSENQPQSQTRGDPLTVANWSPMLTPARWLGEAFLIAGSSHQEKATNLVNAILRLLVPPAIEAEQIRKQKAAEEAEKRRQEEERKAEEEKKQKEEAERQAREKKEEEEREAAQKVAAEEDAAPEEQEEALGQTSGKADTRPPGEAMEGVEPTEAQANVESTEQPGPSEPGPRVRTTIRGRELDITNLGIDLEYLEALPEELREDVIMAQFQEQRSQAAAAGEEPSDISREFLEALPADIRDELLQQEAHDRRRRQREEARRRAAANSGQTQARAEEMDPASFLASLDPGLRQQVLLEQDEDVLAQLPPEIASEARALYVIRRGNPLMHMPRLNRAREAGEPEQPGSTGRKVLPKQMCMQMLDKAGIAALLRLEYFQQQGSARSSLNAILNNICENKQNKAEVIGLLLSILQDGSTDASTVERSYAQISARSKQAGPQKTPQPLKRTITNKTDSGGEMTRQTVTLQSLGSLLSLVSTNVSRFTSFFLTEHDFGQGFKPRANRKGKAKDSRGSKYPINTLLGLIEKSYVMENSSIMEQLAALLAIVTLPLTQLLKKDKEGEVKASAEASTSAEAQVAENSARPATETIESSNMEELSTAPDEANLNVASHTSDEAAEKPTEAVKPKEKKTPKLVPPAIPEENLRLIVNILTAQECSSKTFRQTVSAIQNLSCIPGARAIFGRELVKQAQTLAANIVADLGDLMSHIESAKTGTDVQGKALARFSPTSSDQHKLLRVLTALGYLYRKEVQDESKENTDDENHRLSEKNDLLASLYESSSFASLWTKLSQCLSAIRHRGNMFDVANILLPVIEALMVVCKNISLPDTPVGRVAPLSPSPEPSLERLFFSFTEEHRKILNDLVRHNPRLMSGNFSLLVKNSKVLEFDNKRNIFSRRLHSRRPMVRHSHHSLQLSVRRDQVFLDSYKSLYYQSADEWKYGKLNIRFHGEEGVDAGGVTREWFQVLARQMFNPDYALFTPVASDRTTFHPNRLSAVNPEHLSFFKFVGRIIGKALYEGRVLDCHFSRAVYKRILGKPVSIKDIETVDLDYYKSLLWMLENDITEIITETFSVETEEFGTTQVIDLIENGRNVPVTEENKHEYVRLVVEYRLTGSVQEQLENFLTGFHDLIAADLVSIFNEQELELLISGLPDIDIDDWKANTEYHNYNTSSPQIQWFWRAVRSFDKEERAKLLQFVTGTSKVPLNGFKELEGMNGFSRFNIHRDYGSKDRLPSSHTCFNQIDLPEYETYEQLRQQVYTAITAGSQYFGFA